MDGRYPFKYDAFISYRHCEPDKSVAEKLHRMLEGFRIPKSIAKTCGKKVIKRVFRDRDELPTSANLADNITEALKDSEYLIVVCSPRTPLSQWVLKEIEDFKSMHGHNKILALLIEGDPQESFPKQLCYVSQEMFGDGSTTETIVEVEPLAADIRASSEKEMFRKLRTEILRLLSPMLNCGFDDLRQRHRERRIKAILTAAASISAIFIAFGAVSMYQSMVISQKNQEISKKNEEIVTQIKKAQTTQSRYLADISSRLLKEGDRYRAVLVAAEALPRDLEDPERPYVEEAEYALANALGVYEIDSMHDMDLVLDHNKPVSYIKLSPDSKTLVTLSNDGCAYMWNMEDGKCLGKYLTNHSSLLSSDSIAFIDNNTIIAAGFDGVACFDTKGDVKWQKEIMASKISVAGGNRVLAQSTDYLQVLDAATGDILLEIDLKKYIDSSDFSKYISCIRFSTDGGLIGIGTSFGKVFVFDSVTGALARSYDTGYKSVSGLAFSPEGYIAAASNELNMDDLLARGKGMLNIYPPMSDGSDARSIMFDYSSISNIEFNPFDSNLVILIEGEKLNICDITSGQTVYSFISGDGITGYEIFDGFVVTSSLDGTIRFCFLKNEGFESSWHRITRPDPIGGLEIGNGRIAFTCRNSKKVYIMRILSNSNTIKLTEHKDMIQDAAFSPDGSFCASAGADGELILSSISEHKAIKSVSLGGTIESCRFVSNDLIIAVLTEGKILLLDKNLQTVKQQTSDKISWVLFNTDNSLFAIGCGSQITVFSSEKLDTIASAEAGYTTSCSFTTDNRLLIVDSISKAKLVDLSSGFETMLSDESNIITGTVSADGKKYAIAYDDKTIKLYDNVDSNKEPVTLKGSDNKAYKIFFSPDSKLVVAGYDDSSIEVFSSTDGTLLSAIGSDYFYNPLERVIFSRDGSRMACIDEVKNSIIMDTNTLKILAKVTITDIDRDFGNIISNWDTDLLLIPVYSPKMLLDEAKSQLNGRTLTDREKVEMFID